ARLQIVEKIKAKRADRAQIISQLRSLGVENKQFRNIMDEKRKEMEPLQQALGKLRGSGGGEKGPSICSSEEELNYVIKSLQYRIQHESIPLTEEKQILREIKQLEGTRQKVIANAAERARIEDSLGEKEAIQGQVKLIGVGLDGVRKEKQVINAKLKQLDEEKLAIEKDINVLEGELNAITEKRDKIFETIKDMRKQREEGNSPFYQNRSLLTKAKALAANKEVDALKELSETELDKFMSLWNSDKSFRADYEKRILSSLDMRQLSKPKIAKEEESVGPTMEESDPTEQKVQKPNGASKSKKNEVNSKKIEEDEYFVGEDKPKKEEVDEKKLKEQRREEEIAKRIQAEERKRKLAEKAAAKAAVKAEKEAEKKLKARFIHLFIYLFIGFVTRKWIVARKIIIS
ncbi:Proton pump-interactor 1, partial [Striga hermonthica]